MVKTRLSLQLESPDETNVIITSQRNKSEVKPMICTISKEKDKIQIRGNEQSNNGDKSKNNSNYACNSVEVTENVVNKPLIDGQHKDSMHKKVPERKELHSKASKFINRNEVTTNVSNPDQDNTFMIEIEEDISAILTEIENDRAEKMETLINSEEKAEQSTDNKLDLCTSNVTAIGSDLDVIFISADVEDDIISVSDISNDSDIGVSKNEPKKSNNNTPKKCVPVRKNINSPNSSASCIASRQKVAQQNKPGKVSQTILSNAGETIVSKTSPNVVKKQSPSTSAKCNQTLNDCTQTKDVINPLKQTPSNDHNNSEKAITSQTKCNLSNAASESKNDSNPAQPQPKDSFTSQEQPKLCNNAGLSKTNSLTVQNLQNNSTPKVKVSSSVQDWLANTSEALSYPLSEASNNSISKPFQPAAKRCIPQAILTSYNVSISGLPGEVTLPINYSNIPKISYPNKCIDVTLNSERRHEFYSPEEKKFLRLKLSHGWSVQQAQDVVKMSRVLEKRINEYSPKERLPAKRQKFNEVAVSNVASSTGNETIPVITNDHKKTTLPSSTINATRINSTTDPNIKVTCPKTVAPAASTISTCRSTNQISTQRILISAKRFYGRHLKYLVNLGVDLETAKEETLSLVGKKYGYFGETLTKLTSALVEQSQTKETQQPSANKERAFVVSNQIQAPVERKESNLQAQSNQTSNFLNRSQAMTGPIMKSVLNNLNDSMKNTSTASLHVQMQFSTTCTNIEENQKTQSQTKSEAQIQSKNPGVSCKVAIVHALHPIKNLSETHTEEIKKNVLAEVDKVESINDKLGFMGSKYKDGGLVLTCNNDETKNWLLRIIETLNPFPAGSLKVIDENCLERYLCLTHIPGEDKMPFSQLLLRLEKQNAGLSTKSWQLIKTVEVENGGENLLFSVDKLSKEKIINQSGKLYLNFIRIGIKMKDKDGKTDISVIKTPTKDKIDDDTTNSVNPSTNKFTKTLELLTARAQLFRSLHESSSSTNNIEQSNKEADVEMVHIPNESSTKNPVQTSKKFCGSRDKINDVNQISNLLSGSSNTSNTILKKNNPAELPATQVLKTLPNTSSTTKQLQQSNKEDSVETTVQIPNESSKTNPIQPLKRFSDFPPSQNLSSSEVSNMNQSPIFLPSSLHSTSTKRDINNRTKPPSIRNSNRNTMDNPATEVLKTLPNTSSTTKQLQQSNKEADVEMVHIRNECSTKNPVQPSKKFCGSRDKISDVKQMPILLSGSSNTSNTVLKRNNPPEHPATQVLKTLPNTSSTTKKLKQSNKEASIETTVQMPNESRKRNPIQPLKRLCDFPPSQNFSRREVSNMNQSPIFLPSNSHSTNTQWDRNNRTQLLAIQNSNRNNMDYSYQPSVSTNANCYTNWNTANSMYSNNYPRNMTYNNYNQPYMDGTRFNQSIFHLNPGNSFSSNSTFKPYNMGFSPPMTNEFQNNFTNWYQK